MSIAERELQLGAEVDRFWQGVDQRTETPAGVAEAHTDSLLFVWGIAGTPLELPQPSYRVFIPAPYYVIAWGLAGDAVGNAVITVEHATYSGTSGAIGFSSCTGGADPTLSAQQAVVTRRLPTWTPNRWGMFDLVHISLASTSGLQELVFQIFARRVPRTGRQGVISDSGGNQLTTSDGTPIVLSHP